jgi:hypothetical protein
MKYTTKDVTQPKEGLVVRKDSYWLCENGDPAKAFFWGPAPQCNKDKRIMDWRLSQPNTIPDNAQIVFIEYAYIPQVN